MIIERDAKIPSVVQITANASGPRVVAIRRRARRRAERRPRHREAVLRPLRGDEKAAAGLADAGARQRAGARGRAQVPEAQSQSSVSRDYGPEIDRTCYEFKRAQELKSVLHNCDYFLDLHSAPIAQEPFVVAEQGVVDFFSRLGIPRIMTGWSKFSSGAIGGDAENYANAHGAKSATVESGSHFDKRSNDVAYRSVLSLLRCSI